MDTINSAVNELIQFIFGLICHQDQSVLLRINNEFIPLCPRCIGLHSGFFFSLFFLILFNIKSINTQKNYQLIILLIVISTAAIHWFLVNINLLEQDSTLRLITGLISGIGFAFLITLTEINKKHNTSLIKALTTTLLFSGISFFLFSFSYDNTFLKLAIFSLVIFNMVFILIVILQLVFKLIIDKILLTNTGRIKNETG